jgi:hypothetical protein
MKMHVIPFAQHGRRYQRGSVDLASYSPLGANEFASLNHVTPPSLTRINSNCLTQARFVGLVFAHMYLAESDGFFQRF